MPAGGERSPPTSEEPAPFRRGLSGLWIIRDDADWNLLDLPDLRKQQWRMFVMPRADADADADAGIDAGVERKENSCGS